MRHYIYCLDLEGLKVNRVNLMYEKKKEKKREFVRIHVYDQMELAIYTCMLTTRWTLMAVYLCAYDQVDIDGCIPVCLRPGGH